MIFHHGKQPLIGLPSGPEAASLPAFPGGGRTRDPVSPTARRGLVFFPGGGEDARLGDARRKAWRRETPDLEIQDSSGEDEVFPKGAHGKTEGRGTMTRQTELHENLIPRHEE